MPEQQETLEGFTESTFSDGGISHQVFRAGAGPAVILIHEVPGIHPGVVDLARRLTGGGYTVYLPSMFGRPGGAAGGRAIAKSIAKVCISREFAVLADRSSPATGWLRALAAQAHRGMRRSRCRGDRHVHDRELRPRHGSGTRGAGAGHEPARAAGGPDRPAPCRRRAGRRRTGRVKARTSQGLGLLGLRFSDDRACPAARFETMRREFGESFESIEVDSSPGNPFGIARSAHCVLTVDLVDTPGHPTKAALDRTIEFHRRAAAARTATGRGGSDRQRCGQ